MTTDMLEAARGGDGSAFETLVAPYRRELHAHCYRMLGSVHDADDALQEALLGAWRGLTGFEGRSSLRSWLYRIATHACIRLGGQLRRRELAVEHGPPRSDVHDLGRPLTEIAWLEPYPTPDLEYEQREGVELAFVAALQHLPATQRAVLILREVLAFSAEETAELLDTTVASVNSALQRARATLAARRPERSRPARHDALTDDAVAALVERFVTAWEASDVPALVSLLAEDVRFTMPPLPAWFSGRDDVATFLRDRLFASPWRLAPVPANGQIAFACYQLAEGRYRLGALNVLTFAADGRVQEIGGFVDPGMYEAFRLPPYLD